MCPLRFILVFFSGVLAAYIAWRTMSSDVVVSADSTVVDKAAATKKQESSLAKIIQNGFWVFVDMASGRYLWRNLNQMKKQES